MAANEVSRPARFGIKVLLLSLMLGACLLLASCPSGAVGDTGGAAWDSFIWDSASWG
jgi:hypothetical protein